MAHEGAATATIVLPGDPSPEIEAAAAELSAYAEKLCAVALPIRSDGKRVEGVGLYLGECELSLASDLPVVSTGLESSAREAFAIRVREGNVFFAGRTTASVCYAVLSFIEENLGVRWFAPGQLWEFMPPRTDGELQVQVEDRTVVPDIALRIWSGHNWFPSWDKWNRQNRTVSLSKSLRKDNTNRLQAAFPVEKFAQTHPEYYPLIRGERFIPPPGPLKRASRFWPCTSNPEVVRVAAEYIGKWFDADPENRWSFSLAADDVTNICECEQCRKLDPPGAFDRREFSDRYYSFVNAVAREVKKTHPDRYLGVLIYRQFRQPPVTVPKMEDNVYGFITQDCSTWWDPENEAADRELTREWASRIQLPLTRYEYYGLGTFTPRFYPHTMDRQIKFDREMGFDGNYTEIYTFLPHTAPMIWAFAKLQWDNSLDIDELLGEFNQKMFGDAASAMADYYELLERAWNTPRPGRKSGMLVVNRNAAQQCLAISPGEIEAGLGLLDKALAATDDARAKERIGIIRGALVFSQYGIESYLLNQSLRSTSIETAADAQRTLDDFARYATLARDRESYWAEAKKRDDLLGETLRGLGDRKHYLMTDTFTQMDATLAGPAMDLIDWYRANAPEKVSQVHASLREMGLPGAMLTAVDAALGSQGSPNLLRNAGFEEAGTAPVADAQADWNVKEAPKFWSVWLRPKPSKVNLSKAYVAADAGKDESAGAVLEEGQGGCFIYSIPATPGQRFLCTVWMRGLVSDDAKQGGFSDADAAVGGSLAIKFRDANGLMSPPNKRATVNEVFGVPVEGWQRLVLCVTVPEHAISASVMLLSLPQADGYRVVFDDASLQRITDE